MPVLLNLLTQNIFSFSSKISLRYDKTFTVGTFHYKQKRTPGQEIITLIKKIIIQTYIFKF